MAYEGKLEITDKVNAKDFKDDIDPTWQDEMARTINYEAEDADEQIKKFWENWKKKPKSKPKKK